MKIIMLSLVLLAVFITSQAAPAPPPFTDEKADRDSVDVNEVGPEENWMLFNRLTKTKSFDPSDSEKTRELLKEIDEFSRLVKPAANNVTDEPDDTTDQQDTTESDSASSDWFASTWRTLNRNNDGDDEDRNSLNFRQPFGKQEQDDSGVEDIIKKLANDLKKLYVKIKQAISVMKNWVNIARGSSKEYDGPYPMSASASESDGVFVIADPLIGDIDKSNKYTLPINAAD
ncbi:uncharacterized protein LOC112683619 isoform X2 [Sipha flava]|nr:uncharacterized protein LOC112683619 isoform X2 [Sipha flava]XP_025410514.1 uncharacterized protein LOC112683619 isoform X2 [Sipha flava]